MAALEGRTIDEVMNMHTLREEPMWSLMEGKRLVFTCTKESPDDRTGELVKYLTILKESETTQVYQIRWHDNTNKGGRITSETEYMGSFMFKLNSAEDKFALAKQPGNAMPGADYMNQLFAAKLEVIDLKYQQQLERLQEQLEDAEREDNEDDDGMGMIGTIGRAGERYPWLQDKLADALTFIKSFLNKQAPMNANTAHQIAGIPEATAAPNDRLTWAMETLIKEYSKKEGSEAAGGKAFADDMVVLAKLSISDPEMFDLAIKRLRNMV